MANSQAAPVSYTLGLVNNQCPSFASSRLICLSCFEGGGCVTLTGSEPGKVSSSPFCSELSAPLCFGLVLPVLAGSACLSTGAGLKPDIGTSMSHLDPQRLAIRRGSRLRRGTGLRRRIGQPEPAC